MPKDDFLKARLSDIGRGAIHSGEYDRPLPQTSKKQAPKPKTKKKQRPATVCKHCKSTEFNVERQSFADGSSHARTTCKSCGKFVKFGPPAVNGKNNRSRRGRKKRKPVYACPACHLEQAEPALVSHRLRCSACGTRVRKRRKTIASDDQPKTENEAQTSSSGNQR